MMRLLILLLLLLCNCGHACISGPVISDSKYLDCAAIQAANPSLTSGVYTVYPYLDCVASSPCMKQVLCDFETNGGGWTVVQRRISGTETFFRTWSDYRSGFGTLPLNMWAGNQYIYEITNNATYEAVFEVADSTGTVYRTYYDSIRLGAETANYQLTLGNLITAAGAQTIDNLANARGQSFGTLDRDTDQSTAITCGTYWQSGWWFHPTCGTSGNLNVPYSNPDSRYQHLQGIEWQVGGTTVTATETAIKVRPISFVALFPFTIATIPSIILIGGGTSTIERYFPACDEMHTDHSSKVMSTSLAFRDGWTHSLAVPVNDSMAWIVSTGVSPETYFMNKEGRITVGPPLERAHDHVPAAAVLNNGDSKVPVVCGGKHHKRAGRRLHDCETLVDGWILPLQGYMRQARVSFTLTGFDDGTLIATGGNAEMSDGSYMTTNTVEEYKDGKWSSLPSMLKHRNVHAAVKIDENTLMVCGAYVFPSCEVYDRSTGRWAVGPELNVGRSLARMAKIGDKVYIIGGENYRLERLRCAVWKCWT